MYVFSYKEIVETLIKKQNIHEGLWGLYFRFNLAAANITDPQSGFLTPSAIIGVREVGIQRFDEPNNLTVDAAEVNPSLQSTAAKKSSKKKAP